MADVSTRAKHAHIESLWKGTIKRSVGHNGMFANKGSTFRESSRLGSEVIGKRKASESIRERLFKDCMK